MSSAAPAARTAAPHPVRPADPPERIVSLTPSTTEILCALGARDRLVGISRYCDHPPGIEGLPRVGRFIDADGDAIRALRPDLVVTSSHLQSAIVHDLVERDLNVLALDPTSLDDVFRDMLLLGRLVAAVESAHALVARLRSEVAAVAVAGRSLRLRPRVYLEEWGKPLIPAGWWLAEFIELAGGSNALPNVDARAHSRDRVVDAAAVARADPHLILVSWPGVRSDVPRRRALERPEWRDVSAVRRRQVHAVPDHLLHRPGPRVVQGLREIAARVAEVAAELEGDA